MTRTLEYAFVAFRLAVGLLLFASAITKAVRVSEFKKALVAHDILPMSVASVLSVLIPLVELLAGGALLINVLNPVPELVACCLFNAFALFIASSLVRGKDNISCGCFGSRSGKISWQLVTQNLALAGFSLVGARRFFFASGLLLLPLLLS